jgi:hypothetical protein
MNRNVESHFSRVPYVNHPRSSFDRSSGHTTSFNAGDLIPIYCDEILPGDTVSMNTTSLVRLQTMLTPVFGNIYLDTYWFFVPNRLTWQHWKEFMGENTHSAWIPQQEYTIPRLKFPKKSSSDATKVGFPVGSVADFMGINPDLVLADDSEVQISALPFRALGLIWNDFFRDQNVQDPLFVPVTDTQDAPVLSNLDSNPVFGGFPCKAAKFHDYFTSCLPAPQKGPAVSVPASIGSIPVVAGPYHGYYDTNGSHFQPMSLSWFQASTAAGGPVAPAFPSVIKSTTPVTGDGVDVVRGSVETPDFASGKYYAMPNNLWARPINSQSVGISINDLRLAVITQMYYEALSRGGSRYEEQIQQFFGVTNPDSRIQHPEYLGGRRMQINVHEVTNTAQSEKDFLGDVGAQSVTAGSNSDFTKSFTEHGWLIGLAVVRYEHSYSQGLSKKFARSNKFDFYNPLFARIGEQPVYNYEIFSTVNSSNPVSNLSKVFGYQEAWASYRYNPNRVSGRIRPNVQDGFGHWTLDDNYATLPTLSSGWISEDKGNLDRVLAVTSTLNNQVFGDFYFQSKWTRVMPMYSVPGAIGQF